LPSDQRWPSCRPGVEGFHCGEVALDALLLEGSLVEVGVGANEEAGAALHGSAQRFEVATGFGGYEDERLLRFSGYDDRGAFDWVLFLSQVSISVNQLSGGSLVVPRRKATTRTRWLDCVFGRSALIQSLSPGWRLGTCAMGSVELPRVTRTVDLRAYEIEAGIIGMESSREGDGEQAGGKFR
jgi:hypothetical protein